jgi:hypothetical protein
MVDAGEKVCRLSNYVALGNSGFNDSPVRLVALDTLVWLGEPIRLRALAWRRIYSCGASVLKSLILAFAFVIDTEGRRKRIAVATTYLWHGGTQNQSGSGMGRHEIGGSANVVIW